MRPDLERDGVPYTNRLGLRWPEIPEEKPADDAYLTNHTGKPARATLCWTFTDFWRHKTTGRRVVDLAADAKDVLLSIPVDRPDLGWYGVDVRLLDDTGRVVIEHPTAVAVLPPDTRVEHAQVVVHLGDGAHGRAGIRGGGLLLDGDGGREPADAIVAGLVHLAEELPGVGAQAFDVASLSLGVEGVEGERGLARAGDAGQDDQTLLGDLHGDVLEVVLAGPGDDDAVELHERSSCAAP